MTFLDWDKFLNRIECHLNIVQLSELKNDFFTKVGVEY